MKLEKFNVTEKKRNELLLRLEALEININDIEEHFTKGSGSGGQKINKTANCVNLLHKPTGIRVSCHKDRERNKNRFFALRLLVDKIEERLQPENSKKLQQIDKQRKQKKRRKRRALFKLELPLT